MKKLLILLLSGCIAANMTTSADEGETWTDLGTGTYSDAILSNIGKGFDNKPVEVTVQESQQTPGRYRIVNPWPEFTGSDDNYLIIDATDPEFVIIPAQASPFSDATDGVAHIASISAIALDPEVGYGYNKDEFLEDFGDLNITLDKGTIHIPAGSAMYMWPETADGEWNASREIYDGYLTLPGSEYADQWQSLGNGLLYDGFVTAFLKEPVFAEKTVEIKENTEIPGLYKIIAPFADLSDTSRDLIIDCTDPDFVKIKTQSTGVIMGEYGMMYLLSLSSNNYENLEYFLEDHPGCNITLSKGRIDIPAGAMRAFFPEHSRSHLFKPEGERASYIILPGHDGITGVAADTDSEAIYYNLQGMPLNTPAEGTVCIRCQGGKASKIYVK